ncbi:acyl--CoA ligase [bacterium]|nr:acyl--CoA ligase [bacterium]
MSSQPTYNRFISTLPDMHKLGEEMRGLTREDPAFALTREAVGTQGEMTVFARAPQTLPDWFARADAFPSRAFLVLGEASFTYADARAEANWLARGLQTKFNIHPGDKIGICARNSPEWVISFMAVQLCGAVAVLLNSWWTADELAYGLSDSGAKLLLCDAERDALAAAHCDANGVQRLCIRHRFEPSQTYTDLVYAFRGMPALPSHRTADDDATILYTSGSTGYPKGVLSSHRGVISALYSWSLVARGVVGLMTELPVFKDGQEVILLPVPLFHVTGCHASMLGCFGTGRKLVMMDKWDAEDALGLIQSHGVTHFLGVPTQSFEILRHPRRTHYDLSTMIEVAGGGSARPAEHVGAIQDAFNHATPRIGYGLTETNALGAINGGPSYVLKPGSTGPVTGPVMEMAVHVEDSDQSLPTGEVGRVCFRGPSIMKGYFNRPEDTAKAISPGGWFDSGDLGYIDEEGFLFLVDRAKDIIVRGGENISCLEVEACIHAHPDVRDVTVFGLPDERLGEVVTAMVYLRPEGQNADAANIQSFAAKTLARYKVPEEILFSSEPLPRGATEKIDKKTVRAGVLAERSEQQS